MLYRVKNAIPKLKYCFDKKMHIKNNFCDCIDVCKFKSIESSNKSYTNIKCAFTDKYKKSGDCICINKCSGDQNDLELLYEMESLSLPN